MTTAPTNEILALADELDAKLPVFHGRERDLIVRVVTALRLAATPARDVREAIGLLHTYAINFAHGLNIGQSKRHALTKIDEAVRALSNLDADAPAAGGVELPRTPTSEMIDAGLYHCSADMTSADLITAWQAMFDSVVLDGGVTDSLPASTNSGSVKPCGYLYELDGSMDETFSRERKSEYMRNEPWTETVLYATPPLQAPAHSDAVREALKRVRDQLSEAIHTGFRKGSDHQAAGRAHNAIGQIPEKEWSNIVQFILDGLGVTAAFTAQAAKAPAVSEADVGRIKNTKNVGRFRVTEGDHSKLRVFEHVEKAGTPPRDIELCECRDWRYAETIAIALEKMCCSKPAPSDPPSQEASAPEPVAKCPHCENGYRGSDVECVNGVLIDIDEYHEGWQMDVLYPPAPCHPLFCKTCSGSGRCPDDVPSDSDDCPNCIGTGYVGGNDDCQERLEARSHP